MVTELPPFAEDAIGCATAYRSEDVECEAGVPFAKRTCPLRATELTAGVRLDIEHAGAGAIETNAGVKGQSSSRPS
jgi:hypothetical protein